MRYPVLFALLTALFWGLYGPALGQARSALLSPFKPYVAIGFAYLQGGLLVEWIESTHGAQAIHDLLEGFGGDPGLEASDRVAGEVTQDRLALRAHCFGEHLA